MRYNADDDEQSLGELVRQEKFGAGSREQKNMDAEMATAIARDGKFNVSPLAYVLEHRLIIRTTWITSMTMLNDWLNAKENPMR